MRAIECPVQVTPEGRVEIPPAFLKQLPVNQSLRAIILVSEEEGDDDAAWAQLTAQQFAAGYSESDAIYDKV
ncbi:MAG: hypothetical protein ABSE73_19790 [Planctomycetota bacterium]